MSIETAGVEAPWRAGFRSARANLLPGFVLQLLALALVTAYYRHAPTRLLLDRLVSWRESTGLISAVISTGFFGGLLPVLYLRVQPKTRRHYDGLQAAAITGFWCYKGIEVELLYRFLARFVGTGHDTGTIAVKMAIDQFVYCPLLAVPLTVIFYDWVEAQFEGATVRADVRAGGWLRRRVLPLLISNLWVWLPTVCIIYSLPTALQLPLQNLVLCFFTLLVAHQMKQPV